MIYFRASIYFLTALFFHIILLWLFSSLHYLTYFIVLLITIYILQVLKKLYQKEVFITLSIVFIFLFDSNIFDKFLFDVLMKFDLLGLIVDIDFEIKYTLLLLHFLIFVTLKKFEKSWDIMSKNLSRQ